MSARQGERALELRRLLQQLFRRFGALSEGATPCGKPLSMAHAHALMILVERGELSQQELGAQLCIDKSNVARLCARMVEQGHVVQAQSPSDARSRRVSLTPRGRRLALEVDRASRARFGALLQAVPAGQEAQLLASLGQLVSALEALPTSRSEA